MKPKVVAFVGRSGSGKTHLIERVIPHLIEAGLKLATLKHTHHRAYEDKANSDTERHRAVGAHRSLLSGPGFCAAFQQGELPFEELLRFAGHGMDLVLVEGYKFQSVPRIEVVREQDPVLPPGEALMTVTSEQVSEVVHRLLELFQPDS